MAECVYDPEVYTLVIKVAPWLWWSVPVALSVGLALILARWFGWLRRDA